MHFTTADIPLSDEPTAVLPPDLTNKISLEHVQTRLRALYQITYENSMEHHRDPSLSVGHNSLRGQLSQLSSWRSTQFAEANSDRDGQRRSWRTTQLMTINSSRGLDTSFDLSLRPDRLRPDTSHVTDLCCSDLVCGNFSSEDLRYGCELVTALRFGMDMCSCLLFGDAVYIVLLSVALGSGSAAAPTELYSFVLAGSPTSYAEAVDRAIDIEEGLQNRRSRVRAEGVKGSRPVV
ncbi:hypothetical protein F511_16291 [Dorcoceras hygrometricum]|uniref:Uncharacterized protein n=1 Tax=Dorcoceras hygrometricum TaxID=472368 RepID=A0A2Z7BB60_9LAMI|nr:hypothetical protein F511_16291 [Dorcoceras hygrometricum]